MSTWCCPVSGAEWCPLCYETLRGRAAHVGHAGFRKASPRRFLSMSGFKLSRPVVAASQAPADAAAIAAASEYPALTSHLTVASWDDGAERVTSSITVFMGQALLQAALNDRDGGLVAFVSGTSLEGLLASLEVGLQRGTLDWRPAGGRSQGKKRK